MTHREKVQRAITDLGKKGVSAMTVAPPLYRLLWLIGVKIPPPHFQGFVSVMLMTGTFFGLLFGILMWFLQWKDMDISIGIAILIGLGAGLLFGLILALYYRYAARKLSLPSWEAYPSRTER